MEYMIPIIIVPAALVAVVLIVRIRSRKAAAVQIATLNANLHRQLVEKFGSSSEALDYLKSDIGKSLIEGSLLETNPLMRVLGSMQAGFLTVCAGLALLLSVHLMSNTDGQDGFLLLGTLGVMVGMGFLASSVISYLLIRRWGLGAPAARLSRSATHPE